MAALALSGGAQARPIDEQGLSVEEVAAWVKSVGFDPKIEKTDAGEPYVRIKTPSGVNFDVDLYDCGAGKCRAVQFTVIFELEKKLSLDAVNSWNSDKRYIRMFLNKQGNAVFQYDCNVAPGGTFEALDDDLDIFVDFMPEMMTHIGW